MSCGCGFNPCNCYGTPPMPASNCPPSPLPPWSRPTQSPLSQVINDNTVAQILLDPDITYLNQAGNATNNLALPNGNFLKQMKRIYVNSALIASTVTWIVSGTFAGGFTKLQFDRVGYSGFLEWDGAAWQWIGGNATLS